MIVIATDILTRAGFAVTPALNGKEALTVLAAQSFDLVITDLVMPEQDGLELITAIRRRGTTPPVLAVSGEFGGRFLKVARLLGANGTLLKPFSGEELVDAVTAVLSNLRP